MGPKVVRDTCDICYYIPLSISFGSCLYGCGGLTSQVFPIAEAETFRQQSGYDTIVHSCDVEATVCRCYSYRVVNTTSQTIETFTQKNGWSSCRMRDFVPDLTEILCCGAASFSVPSGIYSPQIFIYLLNVHLIHGTLPMKAIGDT